MIHFFELLEREIDFQFEFEKLETMVCAESYNGIYGGETINNWIERKFRNWKERGSYTSFAEVRHHLGFDFSIDRTYGNQFAQDVDMEKYFLYCEMIFTMILALRNGADSRVTNKAVEIQDTAKSVISKTGYEAVRQNDRIIIVEKNAIAIKVADIEPELGETIIEYNHYLLRGKIEGKQEILRKLVDSLEPKRKTLNSINKTMTDDFFYLVNNMNIRHNNCDKSDSGNYRASFATLADNEKESWYDTIYDQALALFMLLDQQNRNSIIRSYREKNNN